MCGAPCRFLSYNGSAFACALFEKMCKMYSIKHSLSTSYHVQTQGQTDRTQKSVVTLLPAFVNDKETNWVQYLPSVVWAINSTESQVVGTSPFMFIFGCLSLSPADISIPEPFDAPRNVQEHFVELLAKQEVSSAYAEDQLARYKKKIKEYFDKNKTTNRHVSVGDIVYVYQLLG